MVTGVFLFQTGIEILNIYFLLITIMHYAYSGQK